MLLMPRVSAFEIAFTFTKTQRSDWFKLCKPFFIIFLQIWAYKQPSFLCWESLWTPAVVKQPSKVFLTRSSDVWWASEYLLTRRAAQQSSIHRRPRCDATTERVGSPLQQVLKHLSLVYTLQVSCANAVAPCKSHQNVHHGYVADKPHCDAADIATPHLVAHLTHDALCVVPLPAGTEAGRLSTTCTSATRARLSLRRCRSDARRSWTCLSG